VIRWTYVDTSAAAKLFLKEDHSATFQRWLYEHPDGRPVTADLTRTELRCALHRAEIDQGTWQEAELWIAHAAVIRLSPDLCDTAGRLAHETGLRSLDAIHLAAALQMESALASFVAYDKRLVAVATAAGLPVASPGAE